MEVAELGELGADGLAQTADLGRHGLSQTVISHLREYLFGHLRIGLAVEVAQTFLDPVGNGDLGGGVSELEQ